MGGGSVLLIISPADAGPEVLSTGLDFFIKLKMGKGLLDRFAVTGHLDYWALWTRGHIWDIGHLSKFF